MLQIELPHLDFSAGKLQVTRGKGGKAGKEGHEAGAGLGDWSKDCMHFWWAAEWKFHMHNPWQMWRISVDLPCGITRIMRTLTYFLPFPPFPLFPFALFPLFPLSCIPLYCISFTCFPFASWSSRCVFKWRVKWGNFGKDFRFRYAALLGLSW